MVSQFDVFFKLKQALDSQFSQSSFEVSKIFAENKDGDNLCPFLLIARKQHLIEKQHLYNCIHTELEKLSTNGRVCKANVNFS